jgi:hypothetical protein
MVNAILERAGLSRDLPLCSKPLCFYRVNDEWFYTTDARSAFHKDPGDVVDAIVPTYDDGRGLQWILTADLRETMEAIRNPPPGFLYVRLPSRSIFRFDMTDVKFADELPLPMLDAPLGAEHSFPGQTNSDRNRLLLQDFVDTVKKFGTVLVPWISRQVNENALDLLAGHGCVASNTYRRYNSSTLGTVRHDPEAAKKRLQSQRQKKKKRAAEHEKREKENKDRIQRILRGELTAAEFAYMWSAFVAYIGDGVYDLAMHIPGYAKHSYGSRRPPYPIPARKFARAMEVYDAIAPFLPRRTRQRILEYSISDDVPFKDIPQECLPFPFNQIRGYLERKSP